MQDFLSAHLFCVYLLVFLELLYFVFSQYLKDVHKYIFRIRVLLPAYYTSYTFVLFTGLVLEALKGFKRVDFIMVFCIIFMFFISIFQFKRFKKYRLEKNYQAFKKLSLKLELLKLVFLFIAGFKNAVLLF